MASIVKTVDTPTRIRVALIIAAGKIKPVWFEEIDRPGRDRVFIKEICMVWHHQEGAAKVINFGVYDGCNSYKLSLNTRDFTWRLGVAESATF